MFEHHLLGALFLYPQNYKLISRYPVMRYLQELDTQKVYKAIMTTYEEHRTIDPQLVLAVMFPKENTEAYMKYMTLISEWSTGCPNHTRVKAYLEEVKKAYLKKQLQKFANTLLTSKEDATAQVKLMKKFLESSEVVGENDEIISFSDAWKKYYESLCTDIDMKATDKNFMLYGIVGMDKLGTPIRKKQLIVIGACPGVGKSMLSFVIAKNIATQGKRVLYYSLEMDEQEILDRFIARETNIPASSVVNRQLDDKDASMINSVFTKHDELPLFFKVKGGLTLEEIDSDLHRIQLTNPIDCVVIDYLQLVFEPGKSSYESVTKVSNELKRIAMRHDVAILCPAQLNREGAKEEPKVYHLAQSGAIEQAANVIWLLHRDDPNEPDAERDKLQILLRKNRSGIGYANIKATVNYDTMNIY